MRSASTLRRVGRSILMGSLIGLGMAGCTTPEAGTRLSGQQMSEMDQEFNRALLSRDPTLVTAFIRTYRDRSQSARLLNQMPSQVLANVPRRAVAGLSENVQRQLTARVRGQFGISQADTNRDSSSSRSVGYGG
ncbi:MAG: hypothetical protein K0S21_2966 [Rhizobiaceae bacterium]|nr:hypothetical protein [Rhizobiaceae bacterium]